jgi:hypothetical protein
VSDGLLFCLHLLVNDEFSGVFNVSNDNVSSDKQPVSFPDPVSQQGVGI